MTEDFHVPTPEELEALRQRTERESPATSREARAIEVPPEVGREKKVLDPSRPKSVDAGNSRPPAPRRANQGAAPAVRSVSIPPELKVAYAKELQHESRWDRSGITEREAAQARLEQRRNEAAERRVAQSEAQQAAGNEPPNAADAALSVPSGDEQSRNLPPVPDAAAEAGDEPNPEEPIRRTTPIYPCVPPPPPETRQAHPRSEEPVHRSQVAPEVANPVPSGWWKRGRHRHKPRRTRDD